MEFDSSFCLFCFNATQNVYGGQFCLATVSSAIRMVTIGHRAWLYLQVVSGPCDVPYPGNTDATCF